MTAAEPSPGFLAPRPSFVAGSDRFAFSNRAVPPALFRLAYPEGRMLYWTLVFLVIALVAGLFGFGGIASASAGIAKILFVIFLVLFLLSLVFGAVRGV